jgi:hypothetical protein
VEGADSAEHVTGHLADSLLGVVSFEGDGATGMRTTGHHCACSVTLLTNLTPHFAGPLEVFQRL